MSDDTPIWRYMDLAKFVAMLASRALWFARAEQFKDDPWEGFCRVIEPARPADEFGPRWLIDSDEPLDKSIQISNTRALAEMAHFSAGYFGAAREHLCVNSWCLADQSMAMWEIYGSSGRGIAVSASVASYRRSARMPDSPFDLGPVRYYRDLAQSDEAIADCCSKPVPLPGPELWKRMLPLGFLKRRCFEYEKEWRAVVCQDPDSQPGCSIAFDLDELIDCVYVGPRADNFLLDVVGAVMEKFGLQKPLKRSQLLSPPEAL